MAALGQVDAAVTAASPLAVAFRKAATRTYVAFNPWGGPASAPARVRFSDGHVLEVPPGALATDRAPIARAGGGGP
jgi:hypothetical protein